MGSKSALFWCLVAALLGSSTYFGVNAEARRREVQQAAVKLEPNELVSVTSVIDGDTVVVQRSDGTAVAVRLVGIKAFDATREKDIGARFGSAAMDSLTKLCEGRMFNVKLNDPPKDKYGRTLANLLIDGRPLGLSLVTKGLVLVYTAFPFEGESEYLAAQEAAKANRRGLWGDPKVAAHADLLDREWRRRPE